MECGLVNHRRRPGYSAPQYRRVIATMGLYPNPLLCVLLRTPTEVGDGWVCAFDVEMVETAARGGGIHLL